MSAQDRLKGIFTFVQVVDSGGFAAAAERTGQTRSAVAKAIAKLEQRLGVVLFQRTTRRHAITPAGRAYYERCKRALAELEAAEADIEEGRTQLVGRLRVAAPLLVGRHIVAPALCMLARTHPRLQLEIALADRLVDIESEGFDLAVRSGPLRDSSTLLTRSLGKDEWVLCASPAYLRRRGTPRRPADFETHAAVAYARAGVESPWEVRDPDSGETIELPVHRAIRSDDVDTIAEAAIAGHGIARIPRWLAAPALAAGKLRLIGASMHAHAIDISVVWPRTPQTPMRTRAAIDLLVKTVPAALAAGALKKT